MSRFYIGLIVALTGLVLLPQATAQVIFPQGITVAGNALVLNGQGERKKAFITVYDAGLYLTERSVDAAAIVSSEAPLAIKLVIQSKLASGKRMAAAIREGFAKSLDGDTSALQQEIDAVVNAIKTAGVKPGDEFLISYAGGSSPVEMLKNGELLNSQEGAEFKQAMLGIWLSKNPIQESLKTALLGQ